jgi:hypothetical protein
MNFVLSASLLPGDDSKTYGPDYACVDTPPCCLPGTYTNDPSHCPDSPNLCSAPSPSPSPSPFPSPIPDTSITITTAADPENDHCLDLPGGDTTNGNFVWLWQCSGGGNQDWVWDADSWSIRYALDLSKCIDIRNGIFASGTALQIWDCFDGDGLAQQAFGYDSDLSSIYVANSQGDASLCVDLAGGEYYNGAALWLWECNAAVNQAWYLWSAFGSAKTRQTSPANVTI